MKLFDVCVKKYALLENASKQIYRSWRHHVSMKGLWLMMYGTLQFLHSLALVWLWNRRKIQYLCAKPTLNFIFLFLISIIYFCTPLFFKISSWHMIYKIFWNTFQYLLNYGFVHDHVPLNRWRKICRHLNFTSIEIKFDDEQHQLCQIKKKYWI